MTVEIQREIQQFVKHADGVGRETAERISRQVIHRIESASHFSREFYESEEFRNLVQSVEDVGVKTMEAVYDLVESVESGETVIKSDNFGTVRVIYEDQSH